VALISTASTFPDHSRASETRGDVPARPGLNPLRFTTTTVVTREGMESLRAVARSLGMRPAEGDRLSLWGRRFVVGDTPGVRTEPLKADVDAMARVVSSAARMADYVIVTIHSHEGGRDRTAPADFLVAFAHAMIDAGADIFVGHGPHVVRGVELYKGKPILYSVGDFVFENETLQRFPAEAYEAQGLAATRKSAISTKHGRTTTAEASTPTARSGSRSSRRCGGTASSSSTSGWIRSRSATACR
jgi:poly-gamma-glutamate synthesis protein (capsule biosynthesis protein)